MRCEHCIKRSVARIQFFSFITSVTAFKKGCMVIWIKNSGHTYAGFHMKPRGLFFEEFEIGKSWISQNRTVTEADIVNFAGISGDFNPLHMDEEYAKQTIFGKRIAHGLLGLAMMTGMNQFLGITAGTVLAFLEVQWKFTAPIFIGDTLHLEISVLSKRETQKPDRGIVIFDCKMVNQENKVVQEGTRTMLISRRPIS